MTTILQINSRVNVGSVSRITEHIGQLVLQNGWESYIAYGRDSRLSQSKLIRIGTNWDVYAHKFYSLLLDRQGLASVSSTKQLIKDIIVIKPDLIHLQNIHGYYLNYKLLFDFLSSYNVPVIWTLHDCWPITGHCVHFVSAHCCKWKTGCGDCPLLLDYPKSLFIDHSKENYFQKAKLFTSVEKLTLVSVSDWLAGIVTESFLSEIPIHRIYNGIDINVFSPQKNSIEIREKLGCNDKMIMIGVATSWGKDKGLFDYYTLQDMLSEDEQIVLVGLTPKQLKSLPKNIIGVERTYDLDSLAALYSAADIVMNLSVAESFGLTTVEGMSCGTPCIVYNSTASPELVTEKTGFIVEPGDYEGLLKAIRTVKKKGKSSYSDFCRNRALVHFKREDRYQEYFELYKRLLNL